MEAQVIHTLDLGQALIFLAFGYFFGLATYALIMEVWPFIKKENELSEEDKAVEQVVKMISERRIKDGLLKKVMD